MNAAAKDMTDRFVRFRSDAEQLDRDELVRRLSRFAVYVTVHLEHGPDGSVRESYAASVDWTLHGLPSALAERQLMDLLYS